MAKKQPKYYVVWKGRKKGVFNSWDECKKQVDNFPGGKFKAFPTRAEAEYAYNDDYRNHIRFGEKKKIVATHKRSELVAPLITHSISVDGACQGNPGIAEYQGVITTTKEKLFHGGPFHDGTNNIMEFLALVHGLSYCKKKDIKVPIYSDSKIAINWIKEKK